MKDMVFQFEEELEAEVRSRGFGDIPVVLDPSSGKAKVRKPKGPYNEVTSVYAKLFDKKWSGHASCRNSDTNVFIDPAHAGRKLYTRIPDLAFGGPDKTKSETKEGETISSPKHLDETPKIYATRETKETVNPDVVFQFSWANTMSYEERAIDDMMNRAQVHYVPIQQHNDAPKVGYLVKVRRSSKRDARDRVLLNQLDIYCLPRGTTLEDAAANWNGATHESFSPGDLEVLIRVTAQDLDIPVGTAGIPSDFVIRASKILSRITST